MRAFGSNLSKDWWQYCRLIALCVSVCVILIGAVLLTFQNHWAGLGAFGPWFAFTLLPLFVVVAIGAQARLQERADMLGGPAPIERDAES